MKKTIPSAFVIEDDPDLNVIFGKALAAAKYDVKRFFSAEDAWEQLQEEIPHLILLDLNLPGITGVEFLKQIRSHDNYSTIKMVVSSANHLLADTTHELADLVLVKPVAFRQLKELVARLRDV